jgi:hypothetical protein
MDVTHPSPGTVKGTPSVAAVVATIDDHFAQFPASLKIQKTKKEVSPSYELGPNAADNLLDDNRSEVHDGGTFGPLSETQEDSATSNHCLP